MARGLPIAHSVEVGGGGRWVVGGRRERLAGTNSLAEIYSAKSDGAIRLGRLLTWPRVRPRPSPPLWLVLRFATEF